MRKNSLWKTSLLIITLMVSVIGYGQTKQPIPLAIWDFDGTIIDGDCSTGLVRDGRTIYDGMIAAWIMSGNCEKYKGKDGAASFLKICSEKENAGLKYEAYKDETAIFAGVDVNVFQTFCKKRFDVLKKYYFVESIRKIQELKAAGVEIHIISASADLVVRSAAQTLGIPEENIHGIRLVIENGKTTDQVMEPLPYGKGKILVMRQIEKERGGKALYGFGNSYSTDGPFLLEIVKQGGKSVMINGGQPRPGMTEHFQGITLTETFESQTKATEKK